METHKNPDRCPCLGKGWLQPENERMARCPVHFRKQPRPDDKSPKAKRFRWDRVLWELYQETLWAIREDVIVELMARGQDRAGAERTWARGLLGAVPGNTPQEQAPREWIKAAEDFQRRMLETQGPPYQGAK